MFSIANNSQPLPEHTSQEELLILRERFYAHERQFVAQLVEQRERLDRHELRLAATEARLNARSNPGSDVGSRDEPDNGTASKLHTASYELAAGLLIEDRVKRLEEDLRLHTTRENDPQVPLNSDMMSVMRELEMRQNQQHESLESLKRQVRSLDTIPEVLDRFAEVEQKISGSPISTQPNAATSQASDTTYEHMGIRHRDSRMPTNDGKRFAKDLKERPEYVLTYSIWDLLLFIGTSELRTYGSCYTFLLAVVNVGLQCCFVMVCNANFLEPDIQMSVVTAAEFFRAAFGHDLRHIDPHTGETLASRVCHAPQYQLEIGTAQANLVENTQKFLSTGEDMGTFRQLFNGQTMCVLALVTWTASIMRELQSISNFAMSVASLPECPPDEWTKIGVLFRIEPCDSHNTLYFDKFNKVRKLLVFVSIVVRLTIAGNLFVVGSIWLATTIDVRELLLNTVALEFVLQIDEILFEALTPGHARALISNFIPLRRPSWWQRSGCELRTGIFFASIPILVSLFYIVFTVPMVTDMEAAVQALCAPPLDFAYGVDVFNVVHLSRATASTTSGDLKRQAVEEALGNGGVYTNLKCSINPVHLWSTPMKDIIGMTPNELTDVYNPVCQDRQYFNAVGSPIRDAIDFHLQQMLGATSCAESKRFCFDFDTAKGNLIRTLCPRTCGCHRPDSDLPVATTSYGCPSACRISTEWNLAREEAPCVDPTVSELNQTTYWKQWVNFTTEREDKDIGDAMARHGCKFASNLPPHLIWLAGTIKKRACTGVFLKSISIACPQACDCDKGESALCPDGPVSPWCQCQGYFDYLPANRAINNPVCRESFCHSNDWPIQAAHYLGSNFDVAPLQEVVLQECRNRSQLLSTTMTTTKAGEVVTDVANADANADTGKKR